MSDALLTTSEDGTLTITINRPEARNAVNKEVAEGIAAALDELDGNDDLAVGILTGAGGTFCSGMDLKAFLRGETPIVAGRGFGGLTQQLPKKPLIAAVDGYALAGGMELAISCDLIVANREAKFGIPEVKRGLAAGAGGLLKLPRQIAPRLAMELALTGEFIGAERAHEIGLVNHITFGPAIEGAKELAQKIAGNGPLAVRVSKQVIVESAGWSEQEMWKKQNELTAPVFVSEDAREGAAAFAEKRKPEWKGK